VDKTEYLYNIVRKKGCYFLSRPRRFGKSLLLGTAHALLLGHREYFKGLWIDSSNYDFKQYPVVHLDMTGDCESTTALKNNISGKLRAEAEDNNIAELREPLLGGMLSELVRALKRQTGEKVAILIDEYDAPIQGVIGDLDQAEKNRITLHDFYSALKSMADRGQTHVILVTGITKFAQTSLFSVFNNLKDLTMDPRYNAICGFTKGEFEAYFSDYLPEVLEFNKSKGFLPPTTTLGDLKKAILDYYDGYSWDGEERVLNPLSLVKTLAEKKFYPHWFTSATPTFLLKLLKTENIIEFPENPVMARTDLAEVDIENLALTPLMFQTGYLTIEKEIKANIYQLRLPNTEVEYALKGHLLKYLIGQGEASVNHLRERIRKALESFDATGLATCFRDILLWNTHVELRAMEENYLGLLASVLKALHFSVIFQSVESEGVADLLITLGKMMAFVFEFKYNPLDADQKKMTEEQLRVERQKLLNDGINTAKNQIAFRRYSAKYTREYETVKKVAVSIVGKTDVAVEIY
jgi:hypothetical protein